MLWYTGKSKVNYHVFV